MRHKKDNGLKIVNVNGEMMDEEWENIATEFINCEFE